MKQYTSDFDLLRHELARLKELPPWGSLQEDHWDHAFCIFFGPTPASAGDQPRAASPFNILGRVLGDASQFRGEGKSPYPSG